MDFPKQPPQRGSQRRSPKAMGPGGAAEADENAGPTRPAPAGGASPLRKKVLGERNSVDGKGMEAATPPPPLKPAPSPPSLTGRGAGPYDPKTNYTTPRPKFLRYDPERHREMLLRLAREAEVEDDCSRTASGVSASVRSASSVSSASDSESEAELDDGDDEEVFVPARRGRWARRLFLLLAVVAWSFFYIYCMNPTPFPVHSEDDLGFIRPIGGVYDAGVHELDSARLLGLGPLYMMGPEDVLEETIGQIVARESEGAVHQYDQRDFSRNLMAIAMMGLADMCPSEQFGEFTCMIGDENSENVDDLKENSELSEQNAAVLMATSNEVVCLDGNISRHSIVSTPTQTVDMEGGSSGLVHQEVGEDYSNQVVPSMEKTIGSVSDELNGGMGLESEGLDLDTELWQYEMTAEAAKAIWTKVKFLRSAVEPHWWQILACFSIAGFVATMFKYYPRSGEIAVPMSQEMPSKSLGQLPVLATHQIVQLPVSPSPLADQQPVQLPVRKQDLSRSLEVPMQLPLPKSGQFVSFKDPEQLSLPKTDPFVSLRVPVIEHGSRDQKRQQRDAETMKASHGNPRGHRDNDSSKPPVVELLGEFTFADSSRAKSIRNLNGHAGDVPVQESSESLGEDVDKMKKDSIFQTPSVRRARKKENAEKAEKDVTPTPLRRSGRLRSKMTSP